MSGWNQGAPSAPLMTFVSASGGVGKSTLALFAGWLSARAGIQTTILEADLQFGDMGFWLGLDDELPDLGLGANASPINLREGLSLYKAPCLPEVAEEVTEDVVRLIPRIRSKAELVIADTGQFWSGLTADLVCNSDLVLIVVDPRPASIVGAVKARELLGRLGIPSSRCVCVYNRWNSRVHLSTQDVSRGTGVQLVKPVPDGRDEVGVLLTAGDVDELIGSGNAAARGVDALLSDVLPRLGKAYAGTGARKKARRFG